MIGLIGIIILLIVLDFGSPNFGFEEFVIIVVLIFFFGMDILHTLIILMTYRFIVMTQSDSRKNYI